MSAQRLTIQGDFLFRIVLFAFRFAWAKSLLPARLDALLSAPDFLTGLPTLGTSGRIHRASSAGNVGLFTCRSLHIDAASSHLNAAAMLRRRLCVSRDMRVRHEVSELDQRTQVPARKSVPMHQHLPWYLLYFLVSFSRLALHTVSH